MVAEDQRARHLAPPGLSALEIAAGIPLGLGPDTPLPRVTAPPLQALEEVVAPAVRRPPCVVAFSGGRDSSLVLAAAVRSAATQGCDPPIPATTRFPRDSDTHEDDWQRLVLDHLGLSNHAVVDLEHEVDLVGPIAQAELRRRGVLYPANSHIMAALTQLASGGSLLVGVGGDELLSGHRWTRLNDALARRQRPVPRDVVRLAVAALPSRVRSRILLRHHGLEPSRWLRADTGARIRQLYAALLDEPVRFDRVVAHALRTRKVIVAQETLRRLSDGVRIEAPLLDPRFVAALAHAGGPRGWGDRVAAMHAIAGGVLPDALLARRDKARFVGSYFGEATRAFAREWSGEGVDATLVDGDALRNEWLQPRPDFRSALPLQIAWLHDHATEERW